jgi:hypothetical protein
MRDDGDGDGVYKPPLPLYCEFIGMKGGGSETNGEKL